ncbi:putative EamA domain-containing protein [Helianthus annuus]|uniref:WAT1-related protein n=1 Tax=Helianthus annuus TaxID=4232 RepID=A0A251RTK5_HELAN|nr:WAT1-related protein At5g40240 isoform X1 [Helianthus annuus]KAF5755103.1 putative EamA domain-containing protein [Helianthus annuus]KAJ0428878.1 putative EamA domain-containing protein [Helianthus annuus]KAJ0433078.1 putative EamA domain-containing protein [Helianthus annuus]KAJ0447220.1 putative EamA domain-containing protein [Helianthus annuus]KAJ0632130.1 putative EamA domain-containing protein [Helianthus annuus]
MLAWSWMEDVLPFVAMLMLTCLDMVVLTVVKAAMNDGMGSIAYVVYHNTLGTLILLPFFIIHMIRKVDRPPLTLRILFKFFILGLLRICLFEILAYIGVSYSSPTMASAIGNLAPGFTFLIAVFFRMEKIDIKSSSTIAKLLGTILEISGAMVFIFYDGPLILRMTSNLNSHNRLLLSQETKWVFGGLIITAGAIFGCIWAVLQTKASREYMDQQTIVFFYCLFGTIQCIAVSPFLEQNQNAWVLHPGIRVTAVVLGAVCSTVVHINVVIWCLRKKGPVFVVMFSPLSIVIAMIMGVTFLGDSLHLGSVIGAMVIIGGVYTVIWGQAKDKNKVPVVVVDDDLDVSDEPGSSDQTAPLLSSRNEIEC